MTDARASHTNSKDILQSGSFKIVMTATLGVGVGVAIVACLMIFGSNANTETIKDVGKLLIDTDAGADDAVAILMALQQEKMNGPTVIVGITCVNGNTYVENVAQNVLKTLKVADRLDIPVYKGATQPLLVIDEKTDYFGKDGFGDFDYPDPPSMKLIHEDNAVNAMIKLVKTNPGEITLLALGPLTNVALAIRMYPSFLDDLKQLIILGGSTEGIGSLRPGIEFNFGVDPAANYIVFNASSTKPVVLVSSETAASAKLTMEFRKSLGKMGTRTAWLINSAESFYLNPEDEFWECADAVATSVALSSGKIVTKSKNTYLDAIYDGFITAGMIVIDHKNVTRKTPNANLVQVIDVETYKNMILRVFN